VWAFYCTLEPSDEAVSNLYCDKEMFSVIGYLPSSSPILPERVFGSDGKKPVKLAAPDTLRIVKDAEDNHRLGYFGTYVLFPWKKSLPSQRQTIYVPYAHNENTIGGKIQLAYATYIHIQNRAKECEGNSQILYAGEWVNHRTNDPLSRILSVEARQGWIADYDFMDKKGRRQNVKLDIFFQKTEESPCDLVLHWNSKE
jgi:hypothetical protein